MRKPSEAAGPAAPVLRRLTPADRRLWGEARLAALTVSPEAFTMDLADWRAGGEERWQARLDDPTALALVALLAGDRPAGLAGGLVAPDGVPELRSLWVAPEARGRGLATRLIAAVEEWARGTGAPAIRLAVLTTNTPATALYERLGYRRTGTRPGEHLMTRPLTTGPLTTRPLTTRPLTTGPLTTGPGTTD
ncbi:GNAT family N-acetyltransferase [Streptomyces sp. NPDC058486]|uniref:GNAT family N-acetyltransferase n=1 Tax=unclassified Streptomyces TaxID=2593676 RepID=UPI00365D85BE